MVNDYWKKRIEAEQLAKMGRGASLNDEMDRMYNYHFSEIEKEIRAFSERYANKNNLPLSEVKARVDEMDVKAFEEKAKRYVEEKNFSERANSELALYNLKMKMNRLELLQYQLDLEMVALAEGERKLTERFLNDEYVRTLQTQSGLLGRSVLSSSQIEKVAQAVLNTPFKGAVWSDRVWERQDALRGIVAQMTEDYLLKGQNPTIMIGKIRKEFGVSASEAKRLAVTEGARIATEAEKQSYESNGYDEYEFIAEPSACRDCAKLDGKIFKVKDMEPGENAAPMHPWCHCSTGAHVDNKAGGSTLDREAPNGVWGEDSSNTPNQKQVNGEQRKRIAFNLKEKPIPKPKKQSSVKSGHLFTNHTEAEQYAMSNGVQYANFSKMKPEWYNAILDNLDKLPEETRPVVLTDTKTLQQLSGIKMGRNAKSYYGVSQYMSGHFEKVNGELTQFRDGTWVGFNTVSYKTLKSVEKAKNDTEQLYFDKFGKKWSQLKTAEETIAHEFGHLLDNHKNASDNWEWKNIAKQWHEESNFDHLKSPSEAWADAVGLKWNKKDVPGYVEEYMKKYATDNFNNKSLFEITNS